MVTWLVSASLFFYAWWNPHYLIIIVGSILFNFGLTNLVFNKYKSKALLAFGIGINLSLLIYFKYTNFIVSELETISKATFDIDQIVLPLAISFFTFQQIAYLVDAYKKDLSYSFIDYCLFVTFFPQLIAGPIVHHKQMLPQFEALNGKRFNYENIIVGLCIFSIGIFKKTVLADGIAPYANIVFNQAEQGESISLLVAWGGALAYTFQLYFDFSGYSDMAIGLARMFGIILPLNFFSPYKALNISDFWRRWHITLSSFLRDYLYIPLGGNRNGVLNRYRNLWLTMLLGGIWHGAGWNFLIWGALHGSYLVIHQLWHNTSFFNIFNKLPLYSTISWLITFVSVVFAWVFFRATSIEQAMTIIWGMLGFNGISIPNGIYVRLDFLHFVFESLNIGSFLGGGYNFIATWSWILISFAIVLLLPNLHQVFETKQFSLTDKYIKEQVSLSKINRLFDFKFSSGWAVVCSFALGASILTLTQISEFLYFQF